MEKNKKFESTVKELVFKAYCDGLKTCDTRYYKFNEIEIREIKQKFEMWWSENYNERFKSKHSVFIDFKQYILVE